MLALLEMTLGGTCDSVKAVFQDAACCGPDSGNKAVCTAPAFDGDTVAKGVSSLQVMRHPDAPWLVKYEPQNFLLDYFYDNDAYLETLMANEYVVEGAGNCPGTTGYMNVILGNIDVTGAAFNEACFGNTGVTPRTIFPNNFPKGKWRSSANVKVMEEAMKIAYDVEKCFGIDVTTYTSLAQAKANHKPMIYPIGFLVDTEEVNFDILNPSDTAITRAANSPNFHKCKLTAAKTMAAMKTVLETAPLVDAEFTAEMQGSVAGTVTAPIIRFWIGHMNTALKLSGLSPSEVHLTPSTTVADAYSKFGAGTKNFFSYEMGGVNGTDVLKGRPCFMPAMAKQGKAQVQAAMLQLLPDPE